MKLIQRVLSTIVLIKIKTRPFGTFPKIHPFWWRHPPLEEFCGERILWEKLTNCFKVGLNFLGRLEIARLRAQKMNRKMIARFQTSHRKNMYTIFPCHSICSTFLQIGILHGNRPRVCHKYKMVPHLHNDDSLIVANCDISVNKYRRKIPGRQVFLYSSET